MSARGQPSGARCAAGSRSRRWLPAKTTSPFPWCDAVAPDALERALEAAPTVLESFFWGWLLGALPAEAYMAELAITDLSGPGWVTEDFVGER